MDKAGVESGQRLERLDSVGTQYTPVRILRLIFLYIVGDDAIQCWEGRQASVTGTAP